ncbi:MAG TPA: hypothetical protein VGO06_19530 [Bosea sp. (in: a-proteobacteria)]|uniref:hypothetical protein n=1 Tax=Bosea sp. (in: a-proteobacteria) TaxID=1871050 RepID=UPI002E15C7A7|nr:hypothetical protein [Bosea sp. (in: a-proteobacteria)]
MKRRRGWFEPEPDPARFACIDETSLSTKMARLHGHAPLGECRRAEFRMAIVDDLRRSLWLDGMTAPFVYEAP